jgi:hypothetical protein
VRSRNFLDVVSRGASPCPWFAALAGFPGTQARPPGRHSAPVGLVIRAEAPGEGGLLVPADECCHDKPGGTGVQKQTESA